MMSEYVKFSITGFCHATIVNHLLRSRYNQILSVMSLLKEKGIIIIGIIMLNSLMINYCPASAFFSSAMSAADGKTTFSAVSTLFRPLASKVCNRRIKMRG